MEDFDYSNIPFDNGDIVQWFAYSAKAKVPAKYCGIEFDQTSLQVATVLSLMPLLLWICFIAGTDCIIACPSTSRALYVRGQGVCAKTVSRPHELNSRVSTHRTSRKVYFVLCNLRGTPNMYFIFYIKTWWCCISARMRKQKFLACNYCTKIKLW